VTQNSPKKKHRYISYRHTLVCYDGVQLFVAVGERKRWYICLAIPDDDGAERFICSPVSNEAFADYIYEKIDLLALMKSSTTGKYYLINFAEETQKGFLLHEVTDVRQEWLPERHVFARCHTEEFELPQQSPVARLDVADREIHIDGRWDAQDLSALPDLFTDNYSFLYALASDEFGRNSSTQRMFRKFPWRGGFSAVGFYRGLYDQIPRQHQLAIRGINYRSPGEITVSAASVIVDQIDAMSVAFNEQRRELQQLYRQLYEGMSTRQLLGRSLDEIDADPLDFEFVERATRELTVAMRFTMIDQLWSLTGENWIASAKILMSFFRRIKSLADFFDSGKASFRE
jgi:hypothetical protein